MLASTPNILQMCSFDGSKSTKGASKLRRDLINAEIANLRDLLPLPSSTRQRLSQLQLMALVCVYVRKAIYFQNAFHKHEMGPEAPIPHFGFSKALSGFLMMMTQNGKLLYISDNAAEYLGHSMEDLLIHGDSVYDIIEKQDHQTIQSELIRTPNSLSVVPDERIFMCRMNVSRNARRQMRFGDQKVVLVQGHFVSYLPLCSRNEPVFLATCTPIAMPETRECVVQGSTSVFTSIHSMDMRFMHLDQNGEFYLGYSKNSIQGMSWYDLVHWDNLREAQSKHRLITQSEQERSCILLLRMETSDHRWIWIHSVLQVKDGNDNSQQPVIVCTNQVLSEKEAIVMRANNWLYQFYSLHSKMHYGLAYEANTTRLPTYYPSGGSTTSSMMSTGGYCSGGSNTSPEAASVPLPPVPYHHIHPTITPLNGATANHHHPHLPNPHHPHHSHHPHHPHHPYHPNPVLQYSPQHGTLPYPSFVSVTTTASGASPNVAESETTRQNAPLKRAHRNTSPSTQTPTSSTTHPANNNGDASSNSNGNATNNGNNTANQQQQDPEDDSESPEPIAKRVNHGHHLPPPPSSTTYHHPRASTFAYPSTMFGAGGYSMTSDLGTVVPVSGYYGGHHQVLTSVPPYHPAQIGHHFRTQNKLSLFDHDMDTSDLEQSAPPTHQISSEDMANMISIGSSSSNIFKYSHSALTSLPNQYYSLPAQTDIERYSRKSPQSTTSDYGSGTSSPPSSTSSSTSSVIDRPRKDSATDCSESVVSSDSSNIQAQMYHTLRNWNNYPIYTDLSASRSVRKESMNLSETLKLFPNDVYESRLSGTSLMDPNVQVNISQGGSIGAGFDSRLLYHHPYQVLSEYVSVDSGNQNLVHNNGPRSNSQSTVNGDSSVEKSQSSSSSHHRGTDSNSTTRHSQARDSEKGR